MVTVLYRTGWFRGKGNSQLNSSSNAGRIEPCVSRHVHGIDSGTAVAAELAPCPTLLRAGLADPPPPRSARVASLRIRGLQRGLLLRVLLRDTR
jgi:hypothetical protein